MPAHKRSSDNLLDDVHEQQHKQRKQQQQQQQQQQQREQLQAEEEDDDNDDDDEERQHPDAESGRSPSSGEDEDTEFVVVKLSGIRKEVQCPICLGIIRKTRTVMECLHRFCRECIDKSMRLGNNECPACRTHCASRRSLRDDPNYDALIAALYPDIDKYEEEEVAFHEEEKARNRQIQASISQTLLRQSEALGRRPATAKSTAASFTRRSQWNFRNASYLRGRNRHARDSGNVGSDEYDEDVSGGGVKDSFPADEPTPDVRQNRDSRSASPAQAGAPEVLVWGKGGIRSHTRHGSINGSNCKNSRSSRMSKMVDYIRNLDENDNEFDVHVKLLPLDDKLPGLQQPYLCCRPTLSVRHLCQFIAQQISVQAEELDIFVKEPRCTAAFLRGPSVESLGTVNDEIPKSESDAVRELQILSSHETLSGLLAYCTSHQGNLVLVYQSKLQKS